MKIPDHDRTKRILDLTAEIFRLPNYDQLRVGQLVDVAAHRAGTDAFSVEDARLEAALREMLDEART